MDRIAVAACETSLKTTNACIMIWLLVHTIDASERADCEKCGSSHRDPRLARARARKAALTILHSHIAAMYLTTTRESLGRDNIQDGAKLAEHAVQRPLQVCTETGRCVIIAV